ncbi:DUF4145 domain-containing protein [Vibrio crassostreae]|uniref:hypothetical protein n=1 Tax=Vibrio crassostreae TaxID=246167 RepID=UPI001BD252C5|nr:hypothetical protein [Vibrio crassostreae]CAK2074747.1 DUF4145 domain-containing protein [Vibrio crassostreae]CAK2231362.1 DUF4145 domain-containing protein [Vibrio crassostreae]CAK2232329.1 DUF4145 domain-containing protein [Vibrio crassostreae]CAK2326250.1 DUF4145 domain-containing protein [Vibrio crassostreae]CAK2386269.1 DUF4145 domain-containing protein [Vibrio crassostreae]
MNNKVIKHECQICNGIHEFTIDLDMLSERQVTGVEPLPEGLVYCTEIAFMYKVSSMAIDKTVKNIANEELRKSLIAHYTHDWGERRIETKINRLIELNVSFLGIPEEYYNLFYQVKTAHCCERSFAAMTSAGALGERILNRLIINTRDYYKSSPHYKKLYKKSSFDQWEKPLDALEAWGIITSDVKSLFLELKTLRNEAVHYNEGYDFANNSLKTVRLLSEIIISIFDYETRKDLFWVYDAPGEILVRSSVLNDPFVIEFVLPHCQKISPFCVPQKTVLNFPRAPISDETFINLRNNKEEKAHYYVEESNENI